MNKRTLLCLLLCAALALALSACAAPAATSSPAASPATQSPLATAASPVKSTASAVAPTYDTASSAIVGSWEGTLQDMDVMLVYAADGKYSITQKITDVPVLEGEFQTAGTSLYTIAEGAQSHSYFAVKGDTLVLSSQENSTAGNTFTRVADAT